MVLKPIAIKYVQATAAQVTQTNGEPAYLIRLGNGVEGAISVELFESLFQFQKAL